VRAGGGRSICAAGGVGLGRDVASNRKVSAGTRTKGGLLPGQCKAEMRWFRKRNSERIGGKDDSRVSYQMQRETGGAHRRQRKTSEKGKGPLVTGGEGGEFTYRGRPLPKRGKRSVSMQRKKGKRGTGVMEKGVMRCPMSLRGSNFLGVKNSLSLGTKGGKSGEVPLEKEKNRMAIAGR